jgi:glycosyltransferase involved in cell wall biosynthesis
MVASSMRIGMITGEYPPMQGGVAAFTRILAGELAANDHDLFVLSRSGTQSDYPRVRLTAAIERWGIDSLFTARRWARANRLDVVNIQYQTAAYSMSPYIHFLPEALRPIPVVTTFHDLRFPYLFPKAGILRNWIVRRLARASDGVITTNHEDTLALIHLCSTLIPIGSNILKPYLGNQQEWRTRAGAKSEDFLIVYFGLINRSKGLETLLESLAPLRSSGVPARLALVGGGAGSSDPTNIAYMQEIDALIERQKLEPLIHRTGYIDEESISGYLAAADAVALPFTDGASYRRGTLMAAIRQGCAIVTTQPQVEIPTFVDGENMDFVPPNNPTALTDAMRRLHASPDERVRLRQGAAQLARNFDWTTIAQATLDFYQRVLGAHG